MRRTIVLMAVVGAAVLAVAGCGEAAPRAAEVDFHEWSSAPDFRSGAAEGTSVDGDDLRIGRPLGTVRHPAPGGSPRDYEYARWTSPPHPTGFPATQLVTSWNASTPPGTWVQVEVRGRTAGGVDTGWYVMGQWASGDADIHRTSVDGQSDAHGAVSVDTFTANPGSELVGYQLRVILHRAVGSSASPSLSLVGAMASAIPDRFEVPTSGPGGAWGVELPVPRYSQNIHRGHFPQYGGGGEAWCSPAATQMVVEHWGKHPSDAELSWIDPSHPDRVVDHAARQTFDHAYDGTGNWSFNAAYAATYGLEARITRLRSLVEVEQHILAGVPVITSQSFREGELDGAGYGTEGHILVVVGFTEDGDVIVNDPASSDDASVRNVYPREQFETVWLRTRRKDADGEVKSGSGGIAYLITPA
ncbi:C39 family peptidase [Saccharopolyspora sp. NPDC000359]|uniref:C39 family peptidase n=1 Tax=Saccharopolyspora sp. NPDC000359 TaxID=3154251 RepID=UPI00331D7BC6